MKMAAPSAASTAEPTVDLMAPMTVATLVEWKADEMVVWRAVLSAAVTAVLKVQRRVDWWVEH